MDALTGPICILFGIAFFILGLWVMFKVPLNDRQKRHPPRRRIG